MVLRKGNFVLLEYTGKIKETGEVFDTTIEETARREHIHKEGETYEPKLIVIGEKWVLKPLDESLLKAEIGKEKSITIAAENAFGARDPDKVKRVSLRHLTAKGITPRLGMRMEYNGKMATIRTLGAGRVLLDFNPPLAGKSLSYRFTVLKKLTTRKAKLSALVHRRIPAVEGNRFKFAFEGGNVNIEMPEEAFYLEGIQVAKRGISLDIGRFFQKLRSVRFSETFQIQTRKTGSPKRRKT